MKNTEIFVKNLVQMMRREDISQRELARRANLSDVAVSRYVKGIRFPNSKAMIELSKALKCSIEDLIQEPTESLEERRKLQIDSMKNAEIFAENLVRIIKREGISQKELARRANLTDASVSKYVHGSRFPKPKAMIELSKALNCSVEDLIQDLIQESLKERSEIFVKNLVWMMRRENISQRELARKANLTRASIRNYVTGKHFPNTKSMTLLSTALNCSIEDLTQEQTESELELERIIKKAISSLNESERNFLILELKKQN